jgi:ferredoxin
MISLMPKVKVIFDRQSCIGAGICCVVCPKFWKMAKDGKAELLGSKENPETGEYELEIEVNEEDLNCLKESADSCPAQVIKVEEI